MEKEEAAEWLKMLFIEKKSIPSNIYNQVMKVAIESLTQPPSGKCACCNCPDCSGSSVIG
jgi:uncharacterized protein with PIN domain